MQDVIKHYDMLIEEDNDPVRDPEPLKSYMDGWDGQTFICEMDLNKSKTVLEIGVGTGRLAERVAPFCARLYGIDVSPKTVERARENLKKHGNVSLILGDFMTSPFSERFDVIYSSLTFMHIKDKRGAIKKAADILNENGLFVLSTEKEQRSVLDMGCRRITLYPDDVDETEGFMKEAGLLVIKRIETPFAFITVGKKV